MQTEARAALDLVGVQFQRPDEEIAADLENFAALLRKWQRVQNLVSRETLDAYWTRHVADSLQLLRYIPHRAGSILDLGSGGGFPAIPLAVALKGTETKLTLVESNSRKVAFLRAAARELNLAIKVFDARIEDFVSRETASFDVVTARALASLDQICGYVYPLWAPETRGLFLKGGEHGEEIAESGAHWRYDVVVHPSAVDRTGVVLELTHLHPKAG